jgi:hemolysin III
VAAIYSFGLIAMLGCSAAFNVGRSSRFCGALRGIDQSAIFIMIAGSYTPFTVLYLEDGWRLTLTAMIWSLAGLGIFLRLFRPRLFAKLSVPLYLSLGWVGLVAFVPLVQAMDNVTFGLLLAGGLLYTAGVAFHLWKRLPFQNVIWHGFVVAAAAVHFAAVAVSIAVASS